MVTWNHDVCALSFVGCRLCCQPYCIIEHNIKWYDGNCYLLFACGFCLPLAHKIFSLPFQYYHFGMQAWAWAWPSPSQAQPSAKGQAWDFSTPSPAWHITICKVFVPTPGLWSNPCTQRVFAWTCTHTALCEFVLSNLATDTEKKLLDWANVAVGIKI